MLSFKRNLTAGALAAVPLWVTWLVVAFVFGLAIDLAGPITRWLVNLLSPFWPGLAAVFDSRIAQHAVSIVLLIAIIYLLGWLTTHVVGRKLLNLLDDLLQRLPLAGKVYASTKQVLEAFKAKSDKSQQVVLIDFPHHGMKTMGLVTRRLTDAASGRVLLAVYVPTTPNPTSGYLEIVPAEDVTPTDWTVNEAIAFIVSGGSVGPEDIDFERQSNNLESSSEN